MSYKSLGLPFVERLINKIENFFTLIGNNNREIFFQL